MINRNTKYFCNGNITEIENYELAMNDKARTWDCHHRLETHDSDGQKRLVDLTFEELKAFGMYYNRPPEELIFMTRADHKKLHQGGKKRSEETKRKIGEAKSKKVLCVETNVIYKSMMEAEKLMKFNHSYIAKCCNGKRKMAYGYHWRYAE